MREYLSLNRNCVTEQAHSRSSNYSVRVTRPKWSVEEHRKAMECYFQSDPARRGYIQRMLELWLRKWGF